LKNSFQAISTAKFVCNLLNVRLPSTLKFTEITALVPFSTATGDYTHNPAASGRRLSVVANNTQLICRQTMQLIQVDAAFPNEVSQD
jgi:hypothetical protein